MAPAEEKSTQGLAAQFGGLASLAGISVGGGSTAEPIAVLASRQFARDFIQEFNLLKILFEDQWDGDRQQWIAEDPEDWPDIRDGVRFFTQSIRRISEDVNSGMVTFAIEWKDPEVAAEWANQLVARLNNKMRERALTEAEANVAYLQSEMSNTNVLTIQQSIGRLLETELQKVMLARGNEEFAFRIIDPPHVPKYRARPKRTVIAVVGTFLGFAVGVFAALASHALSGRRRDFAGQAEA
jgi:uncharacterized protein involved in exopolysaccharide biosynthesis